ncbi:MAG: MinD/ParA family protein [Cyanobacteria bacterium RYN_339]|nr:MinD/ParA family protein [Cyanobacteria bacterium RYN_339]
MAFHRFDIAYCDPIASRRQQVLVDLIEDRGQVQIVESMTSMPPDVDVALVGVDDLRAALPQLKWLAEERPDRQLILLWEGTDQTLLIEAMRAGVRDIVTDPRLVGDAIQRIWVRLAQGNASGADRPGRIVAIFSLKGGIGKSTLAANLPILLHRNTGLPTTVIDMSLPCGNLEMYLDLQPPRSVGDLLAAGKDVDKRLVQSALAKHSSGISLLAGPRPESMHQLGQHSAWPILKALTETPGLVIVDLGSYIEEAQASVLDAADLIIIPLVPLISSIGTMPQARKFLREIGVPDTRILPVLNHAAPDGEIVPPDVLAQLIGGRPRHELPWGGADIAASLNAGQPVCQHKPRSPLTQALDVLAREVVVRVGLAQVELTAAALEPAASQNRLAWLKALFTNIHKGVAHVQP